jgi:lambda repressor-like predicted transcriptional regulator
MIQVTDFIVDFTLWLRLSKNTGLVAILINVHVHSCWPSRQPWHGHHSTTNSNDEASPRIEP